MLPKDLWLFIFEFIIEPPKKLLKFFEKNVNLIDYNYLSSNKYAISMLMDKRINNWKELALNLNAVSYIESNYHSLFIPYLCRNKNATHIIRRISRKEYISWTDLSMNENAIDILLDNFDRIDFYNFSTNFYALDTLEEQPHLIEWKYLCKNQNPRAIILLENNINKINWKHLSTNPSAVQLLTKNKKLIDYNTVCLNYNAFCIIKDIPANKLNWGLLCRNKNKNVIQMLLDNPDKIDWNVIWSNEGIFETDRVKLKNMKLEFYYNIFKNDFLINKSNNE